MNEIKRVAVLMATYNGSLYLEEQIDSILNQEEIQANIFFSDDCSEDNTGEILKKYCSKYNNCSLISEYRKHGSASENFFYLLKNAPLEEFDYVCFSDQDDVWFPKKIISGIKKIMDSNYKGYSSNVIFWKPKNNKKIIKKNQKQTRYDYMFQSGGPMSTYILKATAAVEFTHFIKKIPHKKRKKIWLHDWFIYAYFRNRGHSWFLDDYSGILYRQHSKNLIGANIGFYAAVRRFKMLKNWRNQVLLLSEVLGYSDKLPIFINEKLGIYFIKKPFKARRKITESFLLSIASLLRLF
tara:strand:+ start:20327 stop:21214 length:888 start_codon:yes stop_codon:yes gene_type:complete